jgi:hypothetical protein
MYFSLIRREVLQRPCRIAYKVVLGELLDGATVGSDGGLRLGSVREPPTAPREDQPRVPRCEGPKVRIAQQRIPVVTNFGGGEAEANCNILVGVLGKAREPGCAGLEAEVPLDFVDDGHFAEPRSNSRGPGITNARELVKAPTNSLPAPTRILEPTLCAGNRVVTCSERRRNVVPPLPEPAHGCCVQPDGARIDFSRHSIKQ